MKRSAPKAATWWIAVILGAVGIISYLTAVPTISDFAFWLVAVGLVILVLGTLLKNL
ncbi:hypothetical protein [Ornatilinea apprima]|uniref:hypothetical protein n=1 Tax=Ornatilinea apprima TaxID=1134406 RepID=UPI0013648A48|nr:hypothetical protein [Ornatilinea apprima]